MSESAGGEKRFRSRELRTTKSDEPNMRTQAICGVMTTCWRQKIPEATGRAQMLNRKAHMKLNQMVLSVSLESARKDSRSESSLRTSTMSAASTVTFCPAPMATPRSAAARAGASLMPSPTMATVATLR